jgi:DNA-binding MarR family transcriptional regulator
MNQLILKLSSEIKRAFNQALKVHHLSFDAYQLLITVNANPAIQQKQLAILLAKETPYITRLIDKLAKQQLVERLNDTSDRRAFLISLTDEGRAIMSKIEDLEEEINGQFFHNIASYEKEMFLAIIEKIIINKVNS